MKLGSLLTDERRQFVLGAMPWRMRAKLQAPTSKLQRNTKQPCPKRCGWFGRLGHRGGTVFGGKLANDE